MTIHILSDRGLPLSLSAGSLPRSGFVQSVAGLLRNQWPLCVGLRMMGEPSLNRRHFPVRQERHDMSSLEVAHDRSITVISPEGPVVDTNHVQRLGAWASSSAHDSKDGVVA